MKTTIIYVKTLRFFVVFCGNARYNAATLKHFYYLIRGLLCITPVATS